MSLVLASLEDAVLTLTLNRPEKRNAITPELFADLATGLTEAASPEVRAVVLTGAGPAFCAGGDLSQTPTVYPGSRRMRAFYNPIISALAALEKPVIAAVNGPAAGGGLSLAAAADIRIASTRARFIPGFVDVGMSPDNGATYHLARLLGYTTAFEFLTMGDEWSADEALGRGLVSAVVEHESLLSTAQSVARRLAGKPGRAVAETKKLLSASLRNSLHDQLEAEASSYDTTSNDPERTAARAAVRNKISSEQ